MQDLLYFSMALVAFKGHKSIPRPPLFLAKSDLLWAEEEGAVTDATGTIGIGRSIRETPGAWWVLVRAGWSVLLNVPYCLRRREPVRAPDFELPIK